MCFLILYVMQPKHKELWPLGMKLVMIRKWWHGAGLLISTVEGLYWCWECLTRRTKRPLSLSSHELLLARHQTVFRVVVHDVLAKVVWIRLRLFKAGASAPEIEGQGMEGKGIQ